MTQAPVSLNSARSRELWRILNAIPDAVMLEYLDDHIVDDQEIADITQRISQLAQAQHVNLEITDEDTELLRTMVHHSVEHIRHQQRFEQANAGKLCQISMQQVSQVMGKLLETGQIKIGGHDTGNAPVKGGHIPTERPEDYDEEAPNPVE